MGLIKLSLFVDKFLDLSWDPGKRWFAFNDFRLNALISELIKFFQSVLTIVAQQISDDALPETWSDNLQAWTERWSSLVYC